MGSQMKKQFACALAFFLIESADSTYNKVPITIAKSEDYKVPSMPENEYKTSVLSKNYQDKKILVSEDNEKKVPSVA
ncbi:hypothetical protein EJD97_008089 [Solanum chilense]|uniref:Uncharacterized protein n=1 Tax=Solanum chilense TaxID=4083 RepID=A0A6N2BLQ2_SOLCI|nr:hypothetical protein EJD97_008089 [Solanum chilense]